MHREHRYVLSMEWTGNREQGTSSYTSYDRSHVIRVAGKPSLSLSSDPAFRGDPGRYNPEELFLASLASCHMLWYLHLCADHDVVVTAYTDSPLGIMQEGGPTPGRFTEVTLRPQVEVAQPGLAKKAERLHQQAHAACFIANSCNFPIRIEPQLRVSNHKP